eukprot:TRINITY_DN3816_c0_g1_i1.p1 TRINITY_DN3816_c0_g1~~TRINITY_DN3816_c0_g1_i1.p1  ORF type:complete len:465 (-),score=120.79 TRINITY_DN3816_c0_g1_i1:118-1512(-)
MAMKVLIALGAIALAIFYSSDIEINVSISRKSKPTEVSATFKNHVKLDYFPFQDDKKEFRVKRIISTQVYQHLLSGESVLDVVRISEWFAAHANFNTSFFQQGVVRLQVAELSAQSHVIERYMQFRQKLSEFNPNCQHHSLSLEQLFADHVRLSPSSRYLLDVYECSHDFLTVSSQDFGFAQCLGSKREDCPAEQVEWPVTEPAFLDLEQVPEREALPEDLLNSGVDDGENVCQEISMGLLPGHAIRSALLGPDLTALPPNASVQIASLNPPVFVIDNFISDEENEHMMQVGREKLQPSVVIGENAEDTLRYRTSWSAFLSSELTPTITRLENRARAVSRFSYIEGLQVVRYQNKQQYLHHYDWFQYSRGHSNAVGPFGQRTVTMFVYLNEVPIGLGGETDFPKVRQLKVRPRKNTAVFWYNVEVTGREDDRSLHAGLPVFDHEKYGMNMWLRDGRLRGPRRTC